MCGRFTQLMTWQQVHYMYDLPLAELPPAWQPRFNGAPTQSFAVCRMEHGGGASIALHRWGLVPFWAKSETLGSRLINARSETVHEKPSFRSAFRSRRCLIPADGWFEWRSEQGARQPYYLSDADGAPLSFAGLWEYWEKGEKALHSFTIITRQSAPEIRRIHDRQPAVIAPSDVKTWLDPGTSSESLLSLARVPPALTYDVRPVSRMVNSPSNDDARILAPLTS